MKKRLEHSILLYLKFLGILALRLNRPTTIIGIAGSVGKSSTRNAVHVILNDYGPTKMIGNSETGIPLGLLGIHPRGYGLIDWISMILKAPFGLFSLQGIDYLIVEMGVDEPFPPKNMSYLLTILQPDLGILVNESAAHTEQFEMLLTLTQKKTLPDTERLDFLIRAITKEDFLMIKDHQCSTVIYNHDNKYITEEIEKLDTDNTKRLISFGQKRENSIAFTEYLLNEKGTTMGFSIKKESDIKLHFKAFLPKEFQSVFASALAVAVHILSLQPNKDKTEILKKMSDSLTKDFTLPKGRGTHLEGIRESIIIDSSYNASKVAVLASLSLVNDLKKATNRPVVFLFADMRELGSEAAIEHQELIKSILAVCDYVYCVGPITKEIIMPQLISKQLKESKWFETNREAGEYLRNNLPEKAIVLVKGSQNTLFLEESIKYILLNRHDYKKLCRQEKYWLDTKRKQGRLARQI